MKYVLLILTVFSFGNANAGGYLVPHSGGITIQKIHAHGSGGITLWVDASQIQNPDGCQDRSKVHIRSSQAGYETMVSIALSAYLSGQKVGLWSPQCSVIPFWGGTTAYPIVSDIWITK